MKGHFEQYIFLCVSAIKDIIKTKKIIILNTLWIK